MAEHANQAIIGWGSILYREGPPLTFVQITEVTAFQPPQESADEIEVTHFESPGRRKEFIQGLIDAGEATATINYNPGVHELHDTLVEDFEAGSVINWRFTLPGLIETIDFSAFIKSFNRNVAPSDALTADVTWRVSTVTSQRPAFT